MKPNCWSLVRSSLIAVVLAGAVAAPTMAAPLTPLNLPAASAATTADVVPVSRRCRGDDRCFGRSHFKRKHFRRHHRRDYYRRPSIHFNFSVPSYRYVQPRYVPRPVYRSYGLSEAHIAWCYDRYRSYRHWDNTYQPYYGPRKQCWSPYS